MDLPVRQFSSRPPARRGLSPLSLCACALLCGCAELPPSSGPSAGPF